MESLTKQFKSQTITFDWFANNDLMINATEIAKTFGKEVKEYLRLPSTQVFLEALKNDFKGGIIPLLNDLNYDTKI